LAQAILAQATLAQAIATHGPQAHHNQPVTPMFRALAVGFALSSVGVAAESSAALIRALCSDAAQKDVEKAGLIHEHLKETEEKCKKRHNAIKCESAVVSWIGAAKANVTDFYVAHCIWHMNEDKPKADLKTLHPLVDKFEDGHKDEIKHELHQQIHAAMTGDVRFMLKVLCADEVQKAIENDDGLVHEHLKEIEEGCAKVGAGCESTAVTELIAAKDSVAAFFTDHCFEHVPPKKDKTLKDLHPAVDKFAEDHKKEIKTKLHDGIHAAMKVAGLEAKFQVLGTPIEDGRLTAHGLGLAAGLLASLSVAGSFVVARRLRRAGATALPIAEEEDVEELKETLCEE